MSNPPHDYDQTRQSWNQATRIHNRHKGDQASKLRAGQSTLFDEELTLLGNLAGAKLVHLQCNAGQDSLSLAMQGASVTGVDLSDEAISFARQLAKESAIEASFVQAEVVAWLQQTEARFDIAFSSYGALGWLPDLGAWARGVHRVLKPGGRLVLVEFHPLVWSIGADFRLSRDDYFTRGPYIEPVSDYVGGSQGALGAEPGTQEDTSNTIPAWGWQYTLADLVETLIDAGLRLERLREYPHSNGCRVCEGLVLGEGRRWFWPAGAVRVPLMYGLRAAR